MKTIILSIIALVAVIGMIPAFAQVDASHASDSVSITVQHKSAPSKPIDSSIASDSVTAVRSLPAPVETSHVGDTVTTTKLPSIDWQLLANHPNQRFSYIPAQNVVNPAIPSNYYMDIVMPDGATWTGLVLSYGDFQSLKTNVAIMWVGNIHTTTDPTTSPYCLVAQFTWDHEDGYAYKVTGMKNLIVPISCQNGSTVPEFGSVVSIVLAIAVLSVVIFASKTRTLPKL